MAAQMQFWGVEVKAKQACPVALDDGSIVHLSQATLGEVKNDKEPVIVHVKVGDTKLVLGVLSQSNPNLSFDLVFDKDFEISHSWKNGSVHLLGYQTELGFDEDEFGSSDEEELPVPKSAAAAAKLKSNKPEDEDEDDEDEDFNENPDDSDSDEGNLSDDSEDDDEDGSDDEVSDEDTPAKVVPGKKRPNGDAKTPEPKKVKLATPQKTEGKKGAPHSATPHPAKKSAKTPATDNKSPKSASQVSCGTCKKTFNSDKALESHSKAKHSAK